MVNIIDDFLKETDYIQINETFLGLNSIKQKEENPYAVNVTAPLSIPYVISGVDYNPEQIEDMEGYENPDTYQLVHVFYGENGDELSDQINVVFPILQKINPFSIFRIKANIIMKTPDIVVNDYHSDLWNPSLEKNTDEKKIAQWTTGIYYVNTNDGYTELKDGTIIESVGNRLVTFPSNMLHRGTSCTDEPMRAVINFNYYLISLR